MAKIRAITNNMLNDYQIVWTPTRHNNNSNSFAALVEMDDNYGKTIVASNCSKKHLQTETAFNTSIPF